MTESKKHNSHRITWVRSLSLKLIMLVLIPVVIIFAVSVFQVRSVSKDLIEKQATNLAETVARQVITDRKHYVNTVVKKLKGSEFAAAEGFTADSAHVPLPATFVMNVASDVSGSQDDYRYSLVSLWNINPGNALADDFLTAGFNDLIEQEQAAKSQGALTSSKAYDGWQSYSEIVEVDEKKFLRLLRPDPAIGAACVSCHNNLEQTDRIIALRNKSGVKAGKAFELNDLMGAIAVDVNLEEVGAIAQAGVARTITIIAILTLAILVVIPIWIRKSIMSPINAAVEGFDKFAMGDLRNRLKDSGNDEIGNLARSANDMAKSFTDVIGEVVQASNEVASAATEIAASSEELSAGMQQQQEQSTQVAAAMEEMSCSVTEVAKKACDAAEMSGKAGSQAALGGEVVEQTINGMNSINEEVNQSAAAVGELGKRGEQIGEIISVINEIADQTNLLALNAAIEAARAGEHGRGFAVVADEVRKLAERTTRATEEVAESINAIQKETGLAVERMEEGKARVSEGVTLAGNAGDSLREIVSNSGQVTSMIQAIAAGTDEQSSAATEVSKSVEEINAISNQSAESVRQAAEAATQLSTKAEQLQALVNRFQL